MSTDTRLPLFSVALLSAAALAYEVLLARLFAIIQWHHFAYLVISLALLGFGASGTLLSLARARLTARFRETFVVNAALFGAASALCFLVAQRVPFNPEEVLFDPGQWLNLGAMYLLLALPFFFAANAIGLALMHFGPLLPRIYAADLVGAGAGSLCVVLLLFVVFPMTALKCIALAGVLAAFAGALETRMRSPGAWIALACLAAIPVALAALPLQPAMSPYKDLNQTLRIRDTRVIAERSGPLGVVSVVESAAIPLRHAPGLSLNAPVEPPEQLALFVDGNGPSAINRAGTDTGDAAYLSWLTSALPYHAARPGRVLVVGAGGGSDVLQAIRHGADHVDAIELDPNVVALVRTRFGGYAKNLYDDPRVNVVTTEARGFLASRDTRYDLIQLPILDSFTAAATGLSALGEDYLLTIEAFEAYLEHLAPGGLLAVNRRVRVPPRETLKVFATAVEALERRGEAAGERLALIRGWQTSTLLVRNGAFTPSELAAIRDFSERRAFDIAYRPDMRAAEANRYNLLPEPYLHDGARRLLGADRAGFIASYKFDIEPASDDRPYFFQFFRAKALPEILALRARGGAALIDVGYLVLAAALVQAAAASVLLIVVPLGFAPALRSASAGRGRVFVYFTALGLGFLFMEIAFIQKLTLFLHHPLYAIAISLTSFLVFAGLGSAASQRLSTAGGGEDSSGVLWPVAGIMAAGIIHLLYLDGLLGHLSHLPDAARAAVAIAVIAPLAFCMGMPFPMALARLGRDAPALLPWAWGINGCASVISGVLATLLAIHFGFGMVVAAAMVLYVVAALGFPGNPPVDSARRFRDDPASTSRTAPLS